MEDKDALQSSVLPQQIDGDRQVVFRPLDGVGQPLTRVYIVGVSLSEEIPSEILQDISRRLSIATEDFSSTHSIETEIDGIIDYLAIANQRIAENQSEIDQLKIETREMLATLKSSLS